VTDIRERAPDPKEAPASARSNVEAGLAQLWLDFLERDGFDHDDDFFRIGGDSLLAIRMLAAVEDAFDVPVGFPEFAESPTLSFLANAVERGQAAGTAPRATLERVDANRSLRCTPAQERLWFLEEMAEARGVYNMPLGVRIREGLDADALDAALREVVHRHGALRTRFQATDGVPVQVVDPDAQLRLERRDLRSAADPEAEAQSIVDEFASRPFSLRNDLLVRAVLLRLGDDDYVLQLVFHHIVCDGWSHVVVLRELGSLYNAFVQGGEPQLAAPKTQYADFAAGGIEDAKLEEGVAWWRTRLADVPHVLELPTDHPRPSAVSYRGATRRTRIPPELAAGVRSFARAEGATVFTTLLTVYYVLLHRLSGQDGIIVGATVAGRDRTELDDAVGLYANTVPLAVELDEALSFADVLVHTRGAVRDGLAHEHVPFERLVAELKPERDLSRHPIFQVFFAHVPQAPLDIAGAEPFDARPSTSRFDLTLWVEEEADEQLELVWEYATDLFDAETLARYENHFLELLRAALADPDRRILELPLIPADEQRRLVEASATTAEFPVGCLHELFTAQVQRTPDAPALTFEGTTLSYRELDGRANALAHRLRELGVDREILVALYLERSLELVVAILAVLKAGGAYVPLDPQYPGDRVAYVLEDTDAPVLVTEQALVGRIPAHDAATLCVDGLSDVRADAPHTESAPEDLAYVIYTSGSTGRPKGVQVEHRNVARLFTATEPWFAFSEADTWLLFHSYAFDFSVWELWGPLLYGGRLVVPPHWTTRSPQLLAELLVAEGVTVMNATPSLFQVALEELLAVADDLRLRIVVFGGEALRPTALKPWFERVGASGPDLVNMYGITETTVHVTYRRVTAADAERDVSPIGGPIPDLALYLLDPLLHILPTGVPGELYVGGAGVARGYLNQPELTAERFVESPFSAGRLYRTGDRARRRPDGELEFLGRLDHQVKIRGFRIELGEIEAALEQHEAVAECVVRVLEVASGDTRLAAYVVPAASAGGLHPEQLRTEIRRGLENKLPPYMVPASIALIETLPLTPNGKLDQRALPAPIWEASPVGSGDDEAPLGETEGRIAEIWCEALGVDGIRRADSFFRLGGHSLLAARVIAQARERFAIKLSVRSLFEQPTLAEFAAHVDQVLTEAAPANVAAAAPEGARQETLGRYPVSMNQQQLLFFDQLERGSIVYNAGLAIGISGPLDAGALEGALAAAVDRHEALRTVFAWVDDAAEQVVLDDWRFHLPVVDVEAEALASVLHEHARRPFRLDRDLMLRGTLFRLGDDEHVLLLGTHHIAVDAWSVEILFRDVGELYAAAVDGRPSTLRELPLRYTAFATWQRSRLQGRHLEDELAFWRTSLAGAPTLLALPTDRPRPPVQRFAGAVHEVELGPDVARAVLAAANETGVTPYMLLLGVFSTLLYRITGQDDILLGGPFANRTRPEHQPLVGYLANTLVVRVRLSGNPSFRELLQRVRETTIELLDHQEVGFEAIVGAVRPPRNASANPLFQVNFRVRSDPAPTLELKGAATRRIPVDIGVARFDLALELHVHDGGVLTQFSFDSDLFERETIEQLSDSFIVLLQQSLQDSSTRLLQFRLNAVRGSSVPARPIARSRRTTAP